MSITVFAQNKDILTNISMMTCQIFTFAGFVFSLHDEKLITSGSCSLCFVKKGPFKHIK